MASGHMNRVKRPDTWLHRPMLQNVKKVLANPEPSTHDPHLTLEVKLSHYCLARLWTTQSLTGSMETLLDTLPSGDNDDRIFEAAVFIVIVMLLVALAVAAG